MPSRSSGVSEKFQGAVSVALRYKFSLFSDHALNSKHFGNNNFQWWKLYGYEMFYDAIQTLAEQNMRRGPQGAWPDN